MITHTQFMESVCQSRTRYKIKIILRLRNLLKWSCSPSTFLHKVQWPSDSRPSKYRTHSSKEEEDIHKLHDKRRYSQQFQPSTQKKRYKYKSSRLCHWCGNSHKLQEWPVCGEKTALTVVSLITLPGHAIGGSRVSAFEDLMSVPVFTLWP